MLTMPVMELNEEEMKQFIQLMLKKRGCYVTNRTLQLILDFEFKYMQIVGIAERN